MKVDLGQPPLRYQPENPYSRQLFRHLIATVLLAVITVLGWLSLIGLVPGA
jgi:ABC-type amino acid transport system permease subunit